jgi:hypothetical protein
MNLKERLGCFLGLVGIAALILFVLPIWQGLESRPWRIEQGWILGALGAFLLAWIGIRLAWAGGHEARSSRPPSLARSIRDRLQGRDDDSDSGR